MPLIEDEVTKKMKLRYTYYDMIRLVWHNGCLPFIFALVFALSGNMVADGSEKPDPGKQSVPAGKIPEAKRALKASHANFGEIYAGGGAVILPGGGILEPPGAKKVLAKTLRREMFIPSGSLIRTGERESARVRLGDHSLLRVCPDSAVRIFSLHLKWERGEICVQQGKTVFPLRVLASSTAMIIDQESAADLFLSMDGRLIVTVQAGTAGLQGKEQRFSAGRRIEVIHNTALPDPPSSHLLDWSNSPRFISWPSPVADQSELSANPLKFLV